MLKDILSKILSIKNLPIIIADGEFPNDKFLVETLKLAKTIICCDGAIHKLIQVGIDPSYIIGDCDSLEFSILNNFHNKIIKIPDQNTNDLTKAVTFATEKLKLKKIIILGATGLREDHTIANIALLAEYINLLDEITMISDFGIFTAHINKAHLTTIPGQQLSIFTLDPKTKINCNELKWPLNNHQFNSWYQGTLNQATSDTINLTSDNSFIVFRAFNIKQ